MEIHSIYVLSYENNLIDLIEETRGTLRKRKTVTSISQTILKNSHFHIPTISREKKKKSILERHQRAERREKKIKMRGLSKGYLANDVKSKRRRAVQKEIFQWKSCSTLGSRPLRDSCSARG